MESFHVFYLHTKLIHENLESCDTVLICEKKNNTGVSEAFLVKEEQCGEAEYLQSANDDEDDDDDNMNIASACSSTHWTNFILPYKIACTFIIAVENGRNTIEKSETAAAVSQQNKDTAEPSKIARKSSRVRKRTSAQSLQQDELIRNWCDMQCIECPVKFYRFPEMKIHYRDVHQRNGFIVCCQKKFFRRVRALEHIERHYDPNIFR